MGLYTTKHTDSGASIYLWEITETEDELRQLCNPIPNDEQEELMLLKSESRRKEKLAVRALLNEIFPEKVYLGHHDNGQPFIPNSLVQISISHTHRFVAIITHPELDLGIDIECLRRDFSAVEKKVLSEDEIDDLSDSKIEHDFQLAIYWCAKEAIYKRMAQSGVDFAEQIELDRFKPRGSGELEAVFIHKDGEEEEFELEYELIDDHILVWLVG